MSKFVSHSRMSLGPVLGSVRTIAVLTVMVSVCCVANGQDVDVSPQENDSLDESRSSTASVDEGPSLADRIRNAHQLAKTATTIEDFSKALMQCEVVLEQPSLPSAHRQYVETLASWIHNKRGEAYSAQAEELAREGDDQSEKALERNALQDFEKAVRLNRKAWRPRHNRGVSYAILQQFDKALSDFTASTKLNPRYKNTWFNRAEVYYERGQFAKAIEDYGHCLRLDPRDADAYASRGHAYFHLGQYDQSVRDYDKVLQLRPDDVLAYIDRADAYANLAEWSKAAADYRVAISLDNQQPRAYQHAAWLMATCPDSKFRNAELAVRAAARAIELAGESDHRSLDTLAAAHASAGQFEEAQKVVQQAIHLAPENVAGELQVRLQMYRQQEPFRQPPQNRQASGSERGN